MPSVKCRGSAINKTSQLVKCGLVRKPLQAHLSIPRASAKILKGSNVTSPQLETSCMPRMPRGWALHGHPQPAQNVIYKKPHKMDQNYLRDSPWHSEPGHDSCEESVQGSRNVICSCCNDLEKLLPETILNPAIDFELPAPLSRKTRTAVCDLTWDAVMRNH